jgi:hypothetical protein
MDYTGISPEGDLPPNHPLVLEALKGIIAGPISELRTKVDANIVDGLRKGHIDYERILPNQKQQTLHQNGFDETSLITNNILNQMAPVQYVQPVLPQQPSPVQIIQSQNVPMSDPNQMELPLFKQTEVSDLHKKLFDIERKLDIILKHVKNSKN